MVNPLFFAYAFDLFSYFFMTFLKLICFMFWSFQWFLFLFFIVLGFLFNFILQFPVLWSYHSISYNILFLFFGYIFLMPIFYISEVKNTNNYHIISVYLQYYEQTLSCIIPPNKLLLILLIKTDIRPNLHGILAWNIYQHQLVETNFNLYNKIWHCVSSSSLLVNIYI